MSTSNKQFQSQNSQTSYVLWFVYYFLKFVYSFFRLYTILCTRKLLLEKLNLVRKSILFANFFVAHIRRFGFGCVNRRAQTTSSALTLGRGRALSYCSRAAPRDSFYCSELGRGQRARYIYTRTYACVRSMLIKWRRCLQQSDGNINKTLIKATDPVRFIVFGKQNGWEGWALVVRRSNEIWLHEKMLSRAIKRGNQSL